MKHFILFTFAVVLVVFQNCGSDVGFKTTEQANLEQLGEIADPSDLSSQNQEPSSESNNPPPVVVDNTPTLDQPVSFEACAQFVEVTDTDLIVLPDRQNTSTCYYKRLMSAIPNHPSGSAGEARVSDVLASNHNGDSSNYIEPFLLAQSQFQIQNLRHWKIAISGSPQDTSAPMQIDNFFLLQMTYGTGQNRSEFVSAFGTADAEPGRGAQPILLNNKPIAFRSFAPGGTAVVEALNLTPPEEVTKIYDGFYNVRFRALDCGGAANGSDVFAVFH